MYVLYQQAVTFIKCLKAVSLFSFHVFGDVINKLKKLSSAWQAMFKLI
jgi:hypothetical protein